MPPQLRNFFICFYLQQILFGTQDLNWYHFGLYLSIEKTQMAQIFPVFPTFQVNVGK